MPHKVISVDLETSGLSFFKDEILAIGIYSGRNYAIFHKDKIKEGIEYLKKLDEQGYKVVGHNFKFDQCFLRRYGCNISVHFDTLLAPTLFVSNRPRALELEAVAGLYLKELPWKDEVDRKNLSQASKEEIEEYIRKDVEVTYRLYLFLEEELRKQGRLDFFHKWLMPFANLLAVAEYNGVHLNPALLDKLGEDQEKSIAEAEKDIIARYENEVKSYEAKLLQEKLKKYKSDKGRLRALQSPPKLKLSSPNQVKDFLLQELKLKVTDRTGKESTGEDALRAHGAKHPFVLDLLKFREASKIQGYVTDWKESLSPSSTLHTTYNQTKARTARLTSSSPNLQQVPRNPLVRSVFVPPKGKVFVICDASQIEPRFVAHYSMDEELINCFQKDIDFYGVVAKGVGIWNKDPNLLKKENPELRQDAKTIGLALLYGMGPLKLQHKLQIDTGRTYSIDKCKQLRDNYFRSFKKLLPFRNLVERRIHERGYLTNIFGRPLLVDPAQANHKGVNTLIQNTASDYVCFSQIPVATKIQDIATIHLFVHDEVVYSCAPSDADFVAKVVSEGMSNLLPLRVPIKSEVYIADSWAGKK